MKIRKRKMHLEFDSCPENEGFARSAAAAFITPLDPTMDELVEIRTAVSEAVSNCVIHGYAGGDGIIAMECEIQEDGRLLIIIRDQGCGIRDVKLAMEPMYSTNTDGERSGMGFTVMESFMDHVRVKSVFGKGTEVLMIKHLDVGYEG